MPESDHAMISELIDRARARGTTATKSELVRAGSAAHADTWLCIAEYIAYVEVSNGQVTGAESGRNNRKYIIDEQGVKEFGEQTAFLDDCFWYEEKTRKPTKAGTGRPGTCLHSSIWRGHFRMNSNNVFVLMYTAGDGDRIQPAVLAGKCEPVE